jgi:ABC-type Zn uptake system ZnuABC Zn-binding protein ZnuA
MAATGIFAESRTAVVNALTALGIAVVTDPRNARPLTVMVNPPTFDSFTYNVGDIRFELLILAAPPGNQDAEDYLITTADQIMASTTLAVTNGRPIALTVGDQQIPAYSLTVAIAARRN